MSTRTESEITVTVGKRRLMGDLSIPENVQGAVLFAHGSGSSRRSPRNQFVARTLQQAGLATLLLDLLEEDESEDRRNVFDIALLAQRLNAASDWLATQKDTAALPQGFFGASTGAAAALVAAANQPERVGAVVSRGGRPDLALDTLARVQAPTLLIVGGEDEPVISLNEEARASLKCTSDLVIIPGATHLFSEPGALEEVARLAVQWLRRYLVLNA